MNREKSQDVAGHSGLLGRLGAILGRLGAILGRLGAILGHLGTILGRLGIILGHSWEVLGRSWGLLARSWAVLDGQESQKGSGPGRLADQGREVLSPPRRKRLFLTPP